MPFKNSDFQKMIKVMEDFNKSLLSVEAAARIMKSLYLDMECMSCHHDQKHHNPDKRLKTGYGKCMCGSCKRYVEFSYQFPKGIISSWSSGALTADMVKYFSIPLTSTSSSNNLYWTTNYDYYSSSASPINYSTKSKPVHTFGIALSDAELMASKLSPQDLALSRMKLDINKITILRVDYGYNNGITNVTIDYMDK